MAAKTHRKQVRGLRAHQPEGDARHDRSLQRDGLLVGERPVSGDLNAGWAQRIPQSLGSIRVRDRGDGDAGILQRR